MFEPQKSVIERYGLADYSPHDPHAKIISKMRKGWKVLDVGCEIGHLGKRLKEELNCFVVGIEIDKGVAEIARKFYDEVIIADVEEITGNSYPANYFDAVIIADVLEHLKRPDILRAKLRRYLKAEGCVVAYIPNVRRSEIHLKLRFGKFKYQESGILDKTHLRFFTLKSARALFEKAGYNVIQVD